MKLQKLKPTTASRRQLVIVKNKKLSKGPLLKYKMKGLKNSSGRNNSGRITCRHKGGGHKKTYRKIDFYRKDNSAGIVMSIEYDPFRTAHIASVYEFLTEKHFYMLAPKDLEIGTIVKSGAIAEPKLGHSLPISKIPEGAFIHNVSPTLNKKGQISRAAGTFSRLMEKDSVCARIILSSGEHRSVSVNCCATIGSVSNDLNLLTTKGKAGRSRWLNKRPTVRGVAMNPVDHPNGGGEGKKSGFGKTPWGNVNKHKPTSRSKNKLTIKRYDKTS